MIPPVSLFSTIHGISQQYKLKPKIVQIGGIWSTVGTVFLIAYSPKSLNRFKALFKNQHIH